MVGALKIEYQELVQSMDKTETFFFLIFLTLIKTGVTEAGHRETSRDF